MSWIWQTMSHSRYLGLTIMSNPSLVGSARPAFGSATPVLGSDIKHGCHIQAKRGQ